MEEHLKLKPEKTSVEGKLYISLKMRNNMLSRLGDIFYSMTTNHNGVDHANGINGAPTFAHDTTIRRDSNVLEIGEKVCTRYNYLADF